MSVAFVARVSGRTVLDADGKIVGTVDDVLIDPTSLGLEGFRMRLKRDVAKSVGASSSLLSPAVVDVPVRMIRAIGDAVILSVAGAALQELTTHEVPQGEQAPSPDGETQRD